MSNPSLIWLFGGADWPFFLILKIMKTSEDIFEKICSFKNLHQAYLQARRAKRYRPNVLEFSYNLEKNLLELQKDLADLTYQPGPYREFIIHDSKKRQIKAPTFRDRVAHHALCNVIEPIFDRGFIYDSYACRKNKGTHKAVKRLESFIRSLSVQLKEKNRRSNPPLFCLKCDITKYFESINHKILFNLICRKVKSRKVLVLLDRIINSTPGPKGIPIGNLTSQLFANIYLDKFDQFVKHYLKIRYYLRYMDDFLVLSADKRKLHQIKDEFQSFLRLKLALNLNLKKVNIFPIVKGIDFLGYVVFGNYRRLRKSTVKRFLKRLKNENESVLSLLFQSWLNYAGFANSYRLVGQINNRL